MSVKYYKPGTDDLIDLTQEEFDRIETMGILDSKCTHIIRRLLSIKDHRLLTKFLELLDELEIPKCPR